MAKKQTLDVLEAFSQAKGNKAEAARMMGLPPSTFYDRLEIAQREHGVRIDKLAGGRLEVLKTKKMPLPAKGKVKRYIITSAQNNTLVHPGWHNLLALADSLDAEVLVATFTYNKTAYKGWAVKSGTEGETEGDWYDQELKEYIRDERLQLAPGLIFEGKGNTLPTAVDPLSGFETYMGRQSIIYPHAKQEVRSVASGLYEATKLLYSTGTVTQRNYLQRRAGLRAEFAHNYGGLVVEVDGWGNWFVRQLSIDHEDAVYDLRLRAQAGLVTEGDWVEAIVWGDIHEEELDPKMRELAWGKGGMLDQLKPQYQFMHDLFSMRSRNHHEIKNPHKMFEKHRRGIDNVGRELDGSAKFLKESNRTWCQTVVVNSNHDEALERWLREADYREDPENALTFLRLQIAKYEAIAMDDRDFHLLEHAMRSAGVNEKEATFLRPDESFVLGRDIDGGIEYGMHGHQGPNGSKGSPRGLSRYGRRSFIAHGHYAEARGSAWQVGTSSKLQLSYNSGPSSWSWTHGIAYKNTMRSLVGCFDGMWRAE